MKNHFGSEGEPMVGQMNTGNFRVPHPKDWSASLPELKRRNADLDQQDNRSWANASPYKDIFPSVLKHQIGGSNHYKDGAIQPITFITANNLSFTIGNVIKYTYRAEKKGGAEDIKKAIHYCQIELETKYGIRSEVKYQE